MKRIMVYCASPDCFKPNARALAQFKEAVLRRHGFKGLHPLNDDEVLNKVEGAPLSLQIYSKDIRMMNRADAILVNLRQFRGPSMDVGTAFEMGFITGQNSLKYGPYKPVIGYNAPRRPYADSLAERDMLDRKNQSVDTCGDSVEDFGLHDNLMVVHSCDFIEPDFISSVKRLQRIFGTCDE